MQKLSIFTGFGATCFSILLTLNTVASAQLAQTWDVQAHEQAERNTSAGISMLTKRQTALALTAFGRASQIDPSNPNPYHMLGLGLAMQGKYDEAMHALQKAYSIRPSTEILLSTGIVYYLQRDFDAAITSWQRILESDPRNVQILGGIGFAHLRKGEYTLAEEKFQKLVRSKPNSTLGYHGIALAHYFKGDFTGARSAAERAQSIQNYAPVVLLLAKLDALQGERSSALRRASQYNSLARKRNLPDRSMTEIGYPLQHDFKWDPFRSDNFDNGYLLAARLQDPLNARKQAALASQGKARVAIDLVQSELSKDPRDLFLNRELGLAQLANANYADAAQTFLTVMQIAPHTYVDLLHTARALGLNGKGAEGAAYVREFQNKVPTQTISPVLANIGNEPAPQQLSQPAETKATKIKEPKQKPERQKSSEPRAIPASEF